MNFALTSIHEISEIQRAAAMQARFANLLFLTCFFTFPASHTPRSLSVRQHTKAGTEANRAAAMGAEARLRMAACDGLASASGETVGALQAVRSVEAAN